MTGRALVLALAGFAAPAQAEPCLAIHFAHGASSATIEGKAPPTESGGLCYALNVRPGQTIDIRVISAGTNVGVTIPGLGDARDHYHFRATQKAYAIGIGQVIKSAVALAFSMTVSVH